MTCPHCQRAAAFKGYRRTGVVSLLGPIAFRRASYRCGQCRSSQFPFADEVGLNDGRVTPGAERGVSLLGLTCDAFEEAAEKVLPEACGLHLGESTVQAITAHAGTPSASPRVGIGVGPLASFWILRGTGGIR